MARELIVGTVPSEFEIQAFLYSSLIANGVPIRGEVRCNIAGQRSRFDLLVFDVAGIAIYAIEVKPKRGPAWRTEWMRTLQFKRYSAMPIPVFMVCGKKQADDFMRVNPGVLVGQRGLVWHEQWSRVQEES